MLLKHFSALNQTKPDQKKKKTDRHTLKVRDALSMSVLDTTGANWERQPTQDHVPDVKIKIQTSFP